MFLKKIVFVAFTCTTVTNYVFVAGQEVPEKNEETDEEKPAPPIDNHTFVALIDIVFTDGRKRSCTGTIIHENVIVTAAHCFSDHNSNVTPELTASFVVIGTKKMYDTGYENYLPIERVITHPKFKGWTADIALVYTFAGMTSDKPGNIIPLIGERAMTPVDSNVTVLSWGHCKDEEPPTHTRPPMSVRPTCDSSESNTDVSCEPKIEPRSTSSPSNVHNEPLDSDAIDEDDSSEKLYKQRYNREREIAYTGRLQLKEALPAITPRLHAERMVQYRTSSSDDPLPVSWAIESTPKNIRYSSSDEDKITERVQEKSRAITARHRYHKITRNSTSKDGDLDHFMVVYLFRCQLFAQRLKAKEINTDDLNFKVKSYQGSKGHRIRRSPFRDNQDTVKRKRHHKRSKHGRRTLIDEGNEAEVFDVNEQTKPKENSIQTYFKDWRRQMGSKQNRLTVEIFGFVNVQTCKKLIDRALPAIFSINPNHVVCYATEDHYITDEDSGAPAIRQGHLVAVTLGGAECEGDHVAVGMKMSCFCSWIAENLPDDAGGSMNCCKDCCNGAGGEDAKYYKNLRYKTKYLNK